MSQTDVDVLAELDAELGFEPAEPPAEPQVVAGPETAEPEASVEEGTPERPRDEQGRFVAEQEQPLILGRFKSHEELEKAYSELDSEFGRRNQEWGQIRKELDEVRSALPSQQAQQQQVPLTQDTVDWFDEQISENPYGAAEWARQSDPSGVLYNRALDAWYETQPRQASQYERALEMQGFQKQLLAQQQPFQESLARNEVADAWMAARQVYPDIDQYAEPILAEAQANPEFLAPLQGGTSEDKQRVFRNLYRLVKAEQANTLVTATGQELARQAQETEAAKQQAFVATGSQVVSPETKSPAEQWAEENLDPYLEFYGRRP